MKKTIKTNQNIIKKISLGILALGLPLAFWLIAKPTKYQVAKIIDGDTIELSGGKIIRYIGIDTPELAKGKSENQCFAQQAKEINENLIKNKKVTIETDENEMDRFGRTLAYVFLDDLFVNQYLLEIGAGKHQQDTVNIKYQSMLTDAADKAHNQKTGLWQNCAPNPEEGCLVKGNLDKNDHRWYHLPEFRHYQTTQINLSNGDQWFCTEQEAIDAGFEKARE